MKQQSTLKKIAKDAKVRMKSGFWQRSMEEVNISKEYAKTNGLNESTVITFYREKFKSELREKNVEEENFYKKVKEILDTHGEVSDILGRLTDKEYLQTLSYEQRQKYLLSLSENYRKALIRYKKGSDWGMSIVFITTIE